MIANHTTIILVAFSALICLSKIQDVSLQKTTVRADLIQPNAKIAFDYAQIADAAKHISVSRHRRLIGPGPGSFARGIDFRNIRFGSEVDGKPVAKTSWIRCETEVSCTISKQVTHSVTITSSDGPTITLSLANIGKIFGIAVSKNPDTKAVQDGQSTTYQFTLSGPSEGRLMFTPRFVQIFGNQLRTAPGIYESNDFTLLTPLKVDKNGGEEIQGTWWVEYKSDPGPVDDVDFHIIRDKQTWGPRLNYIKSGSPRMCARSAKERGHNFAEWRDGSCYFMSSETGVGRLTDSFGKFIGDYNLRIENKNQPGRSSQRDEWVRQGECDLIQEQHNGLFDCLNFDDSSGSVLMVRREGRYKGDKSPPNIVYAPSRLDSNLVDNENFHTISNRNYPTSTLYSVRSSSPKMCARQTMERGFDWSVWQKTDGRCYLKRSEKGGWLMSKSAQQIGPYSLPVSHPIISEIGLDLGKRDAWVRQGNCDLIQETSSGGNYYCLNFADAPGSVVMFKKIRLDKIETSQVGQYYVLKGKQDRQSAVTKFHAVTSIDDCANRTTELDENVAVYLESSNECHVKESANVDRIIHARNGSKLGTYNIVGYERESTRESRTHQEWIDWGKCDAIQSTKQEEHICIFFVDDKDSTLLLRRRIY